MKNNFIYAEYVCGNIRNRNKIFTTTGFSLTDNTECYRSMFLFDESFAAWVNKTGSVSGFAGEMTTESLILDFDSVDPEKARKELILFLQNLYATYELNLKDLRIAFSGNKGFHLVIPSQVFSKDGFEPQKNLPQVLKEIVRDLGEGFECIDMAIYEPRRIMRMLNTINAKSGLYKIPLTFEEVNLNNAEKISEMAAEPREVLYTPFSDITVNKYLDEIYLKYKNMKSKGLRGIQRIHSTDNKASQKGKIQDMFEKAEKGSRHNRAVQITGYLKEKEHKDKHCIKLLSLWNNANDEPLEEKEIEQIVLSSGKWNKEPDYKIFNIYDIIDMYAEYAKELEHNKIHTGIESFKVAFPSLIPGEVMCIQAGSGVGKTTLGLNFLANYVKMTGKPAIFFSMEMPAIAIGERLMGIEFDYSGKQLENKFREPEEARIYFSEKAAPLRNLYFVEKPGLSLKDIKNILSYAEQNIVGDNINLICIDYLSLMSGKGLSIYEKVSENARGLKELAKSTNTFVIFLSQVNRNGEARDSGSIIEASDYAIDLKRDIGSDKNNPIIECEIIKNRKGKLASLELYLENNLRIREK